MCATWVPWWKCSGSFAPGAMVTRCRYSSWPGELAGSVEPRSVRVMPVLPVVVVACATAAAPPPDTTAPDTTAPDTTARRRPRHDDTEEHERGEGARRRTGDLHPLIIDHRT